MIPREKTKSEALQRLAYAEIAAGEEARQHILAAREQVEQLPWPEADTSRCVAAQRHRIERAARDLRGCEAIVEVAVVAPQHAEPGRWAVEATLAHSGVPPLVLAVLARHTLSLWDASPRGSEWTLVAIV